MNLQSLSFFSNYNRTRYSDFRTFTEHGKCGLELRWLELGKSGLELVLVEGSLVKTTGVWFVGGSLVKTTGVCVGLVVELIE